MKRWQTKPFLDVCDFQGGTQPPKSTFAYKPTDGFIRLIQIRDFESDDDLAFVPASAKLKTCAESDVMIARYGASLGRILRGKSGAYNVALVKTIPDESQIKKDFLFYWLNSPSFQEHIAKVGSRAAQAGFNREDFSQLEMPVPPLPDQNRIVKLLDEADELRKLRALADKRTDALIPALFHEMFGDPISNPKGCKVVRLEEITTRITDGVHLKPNYTTSGVPFISVKNITTGKLKFDDCKFISAKDHVKFTKRYRAEYLDILYTKVGATYGRPALVDTKMEFSIYVSVCLIKPDKSVIDPHFLEIALGTPAIKGQADRSIKGIGVPDLHLDQIQKFLLPLPPLEQQKEFARRVNEIRAMQAEQAASRQRLDNLFQSMLHRAFNGEL